MSTAAEKDASGTGPSVSGSATGGTAPGAGAGGACTPGALEAWAGSLRADAAMLASLPSVLASGTVGAAGGAAGAVAFSGPVGAMDGSSGAGFGGGRGGGGGSATEGSGDISSGSEGGEHLRPRCGRRYGRRRRRWWERRRGFTGEPGLPRAEVVLGLRQRALPRLEGGAMARKLILHGLEPFFGSRPGLPAEALQGGALGFELRGRPALELECAPELGGELGLAGAQARELLLVAGQPA